MRPTAGRTGRHPGPRTRRLTYRLPRDVPWIPSLWRVAGGYSTDQVAEGLLQLLFNGIMM